MNAKRFDILFDGSLVAGFERVDVESSLRNMFKLDDATIARLFSGTPIAIKRDLDRSEALKYQTALTRAGAKIQLRLNKNSSLQPVEENQAVDRPVSETSLPAGTPETAQRHYELSLQPAGEDLLRKEEKTSTETREIICDHIELEKVNPFLQPENESQASLQELYEASAALGEQFSLAEPGSQIGPEKQEDIPAVAIPDIEFLEIDPAGVDLGGEKHQSADAGDLKVPDYEIAPAGSDVLDESDKKTYETADVDTSRLALADGE